MNSITDDPTSYRSVLESSITVPAFAFSPVEGSGLVLRALRGYLYSKRGVRNVIDIRVDEKTGSFAVYGTDSDSSSMRAYKLCLLDPGIVSPSKINITNTEDQKSCLEFLHNLEEMKTILPIDLVEGLTKRIPNIVSESITEGGDSGGVVSTTAPSHPKVSNGRTPIVLNWKCAVGLFSVPLNYQNYTMPEILQKLFCSNTQRENVSQKEMSSSLVALSGFEQIGHIAHVNLSESHIPFQHIIGQVIMDCNPTVDVVVNKVDSISSVFREFKMNIIGYRHASKAVVESMSEEQINQVLLGTVKQHGCTFLVPYNRVYWNSRLCHEHTRVVECMHSGDILFDVMAGVGPFAVPAARKGVRVYANDLNPVGAEYLLANARANNTELTSFNVDGRIFLNTVLYKSVMMNVQQPSSALVSTDKLESTTPRRHVVMNLPAIAVEFLNVFSPDCPTPSPWRFRPVENDKSATLVDKKVLFHVYCFSAASDVLADAVQQVEHHLGYSLPQINIESIVNVRDVAPTKRMVCVSFTLPESFWQQQEEKDENEIKLDDICPLKCNSDVDIPPISRHAKHPRSVAPSNDVPHRKASKYE